MGSGAPAGAQCLSSSTPQADAERVVGLARALQLLRGTKGESLEEPLDEALVRTIALSSAGVLSPMAALLGAVAAQEVLKVGAGTGRVRLGGVQSSLSVPEGARECQMASSWLHPPGCSPQTGPEGLGGGSSP